MDRGHPLIRLTAVELSTVGAGLYQLLSRFTGYWAARVGWDPEAWVNPEELRHEYADELMAGQVPGLVLALSRSTAAQAQSSLMNPVKNPDATVCPGHACRTGGEPIPR